MHLKIPQLAAVTRLPAGPLFIFSAAAVRPVLVVKEVAKVVRYVINYLFSADS